MSRIRAHCVTMGGLSVSRVGVQYEQGGVSMCEQDGDSVCKQDRGSVCEQSGVQCVIKIMAQHVTKNRLSV